MEAAACYVGECRGGARDAKIALTAEGLFGMFIYIATPLMFVAVLGVALSATAAPLTAISPTRPRSSGADRGRSGSSGSR